MDCLELSGEGCHMRHQYPVGHWSVAGPLTIVFLFQLYSMFHYRLELSGEGCHRHHQYPVGHWSVAGPLTKKIAFAAIPLLWRCYVEELNRLELRTHAGRGSANTSLPSGVFGHVLDG